MTSFYYTRTGPILTVLVLCVASQGNPVSELPSEQEKDTGWAGAAGSFGGAGSAGEETAGPVDAEAGGEAGAGLSASHSVQLG